MNKSIKSRKKQKSPQVASTDSVKYAEVERASQYLARLVLRINDLIADLPSGGPEVLSVLRKQGIQVSEIVDIVTALHRVGIAASRSAHELTRERVA